LAVPPEASNERVAMALPKNGGAYDQDGRPDCEDGERDYRKGEPLALPLKKIKAGVPKTWTDNA